ncbi:Kelch domain-containing protein 8B [Porphyridium purpureum]|uniref:Kelch domain-containing protein 8B n=1 Tax=Porphyridium purpureum TaxID=35688 RepID=A0A5J4YLD3_PORPP|nr:Kelch domain-containing protein 8B [Porphyridium purpureum]|eukprot:POR6616..scf249_10
MWKVLGQSSDYWTAQEWYVPAEDGASGRSLLDSMSVKCGVGRKIRTLCCASVLLMLLWTHGAAVLSVSEQPDRSAAQALDGAEVPAFQFVYIFEDISPVGVSQVEFWLGPISGAPSQVEAKAPFDLEGTGKNSVAIPAFFLPGSATVSSRASFSNGSFVDFQADFDVTSSSANEEYVIAFSTFPSRSPSAPLDDQTLFGEIYVFIEDVSTGDVSSLPLVDKVEFFVNQGTLLEDGPPFRTENSAPFDLEGGQANGAIPFDTASLSDGPNQINAKLVLISGAELIVSSTFVVDNDGGIAASLLAEPVSLAFSLDDINVSQTISLTTSDDNAAGIIVSLVGVPAAALSVAPLSGSIPAGGSGTLDLIVTLNAAVSFTGQIVVMTVSNTHIQIVIPVSVASADDYSLLYSLVPSRSDSLLLEGSSFYESAVLYIFLDVDPAATAVTGVVFFLDGVQKQVEGKVPWDFQGGLVSVANPFDVSSLSIGIHVVTAIISLASGLSVEDEATFMIMEAPPEFVLTPPTLDFVKSGTIAPQVMSVSLSTTSIPVPAFEVTVSATWLSVEVALVMSSLTVSVNSSAVPVGTPVSDATLTVSALDGSAVPLTVTVRVFTVDTVATSLPISITFGPAGSSTAGGFVLNTGEPFGSLDASGLWFGWRDAASLLPIDFTGNMRNRGSGGVDETLVLMQSAVGQAGVFDVLLEDGIYDVRVQVGDPLFFDSTHVVNANGLAIVPATTLNAGKRLASFGAVVSVQNGVLRFDASGGVNTKIVSIVLGDGATSCVPSPSQFEGRQISSLSCSAVRIFVPYMFPSFVTGIPDGSGAPTGFTAVIPNTVGVDLNLWFDPNLLAVLPNGDGLLIAASPGSWEGTTNNVVNALAVGLPLPDQEVIVTSLIELPASPSQAGEKMCHFFGISGSDYIMVCVVLSVGSGIEVQVILEENDVANVTPFPLPVGFDGTQIAFRMELAPELNSVTVLAAANLASAVFEELIVFSDVEPSWFSKDAAGIDFLVGTRSYTGVLTEEGNGEEFVLRQFVVDAVAVPSPPPVGPTDIDWSISRINDVGFGSALVFAPNGLLYVASALGQIFAVDVNAGIVLQTYQASEYTSFAVGSEGRLTLGITVDPQSTPELITLWMSHSDASFSDGDANSGTVSRMTLNGLDGSVLSSHDVIVGLPRAIANHAPNQLHFGPDGRLYHAIGGNTGAGASNDGGSEFGPRPEQPLSAALLVLDVNQDLSLLDLDCTPEQDPLGVIMDATGVAFTSIDCDVSIFATGLRNVYDFTFVADDGFPAGAFLIYAQDNGLGVEGTAPPLRDAQGECLGQITGKANRDALNPGARDDLLYILEQGRYYGHPNPSRGECVFAAGNPPNPGAFEVLRSEGGTYSLTAPSIYPTQTLPEPSYSLPEYSLGSSRSANGLLTYESFAFCGELRKDLLSVWYSVGDQVRRLIRVSGQVVNDETLTRSTTGTGGVKLSNPLAVAEDPLGRLVVTEFGASRLTVFTPVGPGCWQAPGVGTPALPLELVDAGSVALGTKLYLFGGKNDNGVFANTLAFDAWKNEWSAIGELAPIPYGAVENPGVVEAGGLVYVIGGSTLAFSGQVNGAARYNPVSDTWESLPSLPTARAGAVVVLFQNEIWVIGGLVASGGGSSTDVVEILNLNTMTWRAGPSLPAVRDNAVGAVVGGEILVFGGRNRQVGEDASSVFSFNGAAWSSRASMPTARRTGCARVVESESSVVVIGGEFANNIASAAVEAYDPGSNSWTVLSDMPDGRHGVACGRIGNGIFVAGGKTSGPILTRDDMQVFRYM